MVAFRKAVSRGTRFSQIYIPKSMHGLIEPGDEVEVRLVRKGARLHYSKGLQKLSEFKEELIRGVFSFLEESAHPVSIFVVGSFLREKTGYNDIDLVLLFGEKKPSEELVNARLSEKFNLKFHLLFIDSGHFGRLLKMCPLTRAMFAGFVSSHKSDIPRETYVDRKHIRFLLMMPYDLLEIRLGSRAYFDSLRRLVTIERFLKKKPIEASEISREIEGLMNMHLYNKIMNNEEIEQGSVNLLRKLIRERLGSIEELLNHGEE
ncbi:hypothetical protein HYY74_03645 [Candidatus Woesearchaeota archaeon]|nr:hypothetical protein [Candidatus Woesearchaeota archaeon]